MKADRVRAMFENELVILPLARMLPLRQISDIVKKRSRKYRVIAKSVAEVGIVEPLVVYREPDKRGRYLLLDGNLRREVLLDRGETEAECLLAKDDEAYTYNKRVSHLSAIQEHCLILRAIERGVSEEKIARALNVKIDFVRHRQRILRGICPEVVNQVRDKPVNPVTFDMLRKMKPARQIEACKLMDAASNYSLELRQIPAKMLVIGGGIIGLEMATVYSTLGSRIDVVERLTGLMPRTDRDLVKVWEKKNAPRFDRIMLETETVGVEAKEDGIYGRFDGAGAPDSTQRYDMVLVAVGRTPNGRWIGAESAGVVIADRGFIKVDRQMRTNMGHIFAVGDLVGQPMLAHKAVHEGHVAAEAAAGMKSSFDVRQIPSVAYTDPEIAWTGLTEEQAAAKGLKFRKAVSPWAASGRAIANRRDEGFTKLLLDEHNHRIVGGGIVGTHAGDLIGEICLAIEMGCAPLDLGKTIHPHPTLGESIGMAAEILEGTCTDLPPLRK